jgi:lipoate-protein ligase A
MTVIYSCLFDSGFNLAAEEFLFSQRQDEILFLYVNNPSVVIGCNQSIVSECDIDFCKEQAIPIFRRISGGGAVFHDEGNFNFCFISTRKQGNSSLGIEFLKPVLQVLKDLKIEVTLGKRKDLWLPGEFKISGTASHINKTRELHHGTLLYDSSLEMLEKSLSSKTKDESVRAIPSVRSKVKNLRTWFEEQGQFTLSSTDFFKLITRKLAAYFFQEEVRALSEAESAKILQLAENKYMSDEWTFKK